VLTGVTKVVLPTTAFYDDMVLLPVPEPGMPLLGAAGALGLAMMRRRKLA
jgi:MYXO-CTERM domain-containing protein